MKNHWSGKKVKRFYVWIDDWAEPYIFGKGRSAQNFMEKMRVRGHIVKVKAKRIDLGQEYRAWHDERMERM